MLRLNLHALPVCLIECIDQVIATRVLLASRKSSSVGLSSALLTRSQRAHFSTHPPLRGETVRAAPDADAASQYKTTIGLELHVQLRSAIKLFSPAPTSFDAVPNSHVSYFDAALPGALPRLNPEPVKLAVSAALALNCRIHSKSKFDRKHYFYPDLPNGFQITQKYSPLATHGELALTPRHDGLSEATVVRISQVQLEQDTAKSTHDAFSETTLVDLNRAGTALVEIISEPEMHSAAEAAAYVRKVQSLLRVVGASDADMEKGSLRIDVNVSVAKQEASNLGTRCEVKNLNSIRSMVDAIEYEVNRHIGLLEGGASEVEQQTRGFDATTATTFKLRSKADAPDYRYMPDPELAPLVVPERIVNQLREELPELPDQARERLQATYNLNPREVDILVKLGENGEEYTDAGFRYFEEVARGRDAKVVANWILHEMLGQLAKHELSLASNPVPPAELGHLIDAVSQSKLNFTSAKGLLATYISQSDTASLSALVEQAIEAKAAVTFDYTALGAELIEEHPAEAEKIRKGQKNVMARLIGQGMKRTSGRVDPKELRRHLEAAFAAK